jgi:cell division inhibitor SulA
MTRFVAESYPVGLDRARLTEAARRARRAASEMRAEGSAIRFVKSAFVPAEDALICLFDAPSSELVMELSRRSGLPVERIVEAVDLNVKKVRGR